MKTPRAIVRKLKWNFNVKNYADWYIIKYVEYIVIQYFAFYYITVNALGTGEENIINIIKISPPPLQKNLQSFSLQI